MKFFLDEINQHLGETYWSPVEVTRINDYVVRAAVFKGEYHWHSHEHEDEAFLVMEGSIVIDLEDQSITLNKGEGYVVPKGVKHRPRAEERAFVLLIEPAELVARGSS